MPAGSTWQAPVNIAEIGDEPQIAFDKQGNALALWRAYEGDDIDEWILRSAFMPAGGPWQAPVTVSAPGLAGEPHVAFDGLGDAVAVWNSWSHGFLSSRVAQAARDDAAENAVQAWGRLTGEHGDIRSVALIADASNQGIDRLNARAQHLRAERGELGHREIPLPGVHYGLREGDLIAFTTQHRPAGQPRVENGTRGQITHIHEHGVTITLGGGQPGPSYPGRWPATISRLSSYRRRLRSLASPSRARSQPYAWITA